MTITRSRLNATQLLGKYSTTYVLVLSISLLMPSCSAQGPILEIQTVLGSSAALPCDIRPPIQDDAATLVLWYKEIEENPVYSFDNRGKITEGSHWKDNEIFGSRAFFVAISNPAILQLDNVQEKDEGFYRCRVDFYKSPTRNQKLHLTVIVPPSLPEILDERNRNLSDSTEEYDEDASLTLKCLTYGGRPKPTVRWWRGELLMESKTSTINDNTTTATILIPSLSRSHFKAVYTCQAINSNITVPKQKSVKIEMYLKPLKVDILNKNQQLSSGRSYDLECQSFGSVPAANITWRINNKPLKNAVSPTVTTNQNVSTSVLTFIPTMEDHGKTLTCTATHPVRKWKDETSWVLDISYAPKVNLSLGPQLNPEDIEEGDDVYFNCKIYSNPTAYKVVWKHNGNYIHQNVKNEILANDKTLVLRNITRRWNGNFTCIASNVEGDKESNAEHLRVLYKPVCKQNQKLIYGAAQNEDVQVICEVDSDPEPEVFLWSFNHSREPIPEKRYNTINKRRGISILTFSPTVEMDFGYLLCWASNRLGKQITPCTYHIIPASQPQPPHNCSIDNVTTVSLEVNCLEGFDGGLSQHFVLEIFNFTTGNLLLNLTSDYPAFKLNQLSPGNSIKMNVYAQNVKGKSTAFVMESSTLKTEKQTGTPNTLELSPVIEIAVCVSIFGIFGAMLIACVLKCSKESVRRTSKRPTTLLIKEKSVVHTTLLDNNQDKDDKNPDLIPTAKSSGYQLLRSESQSLAEISDRSRAVISSESKRNSRNFDNLVPVMESVSPVSSSISQLENSEMTNNRKMYNKNSSLDYGSEPLKLENNS